MSFEEYAALARQLSAQHRAGEQHAAAESARRRDLHAAVDYLQQRLTAQGQRLDQLGRAIGVDQPPTAPAPGPERPGEGASWPGPPSGAAPSTAAGPGSSAVAGSGSAFAAGAGPASGAGSGPSAAGAGYPSAAPGSGDGEAAGAAGAPGRSGVGAYPQLPAGRRGWHCRRR
ncbi:hypothetical protein ACQP0U_23390 [Micromonospora sp. CA-269861]|uniref:hypothetical protein n=1 Tax=Micromonospora sp. CA-269861 TaxID=3239968 RepID=UPI003D8E1686